MLLELMYFQKLAVIIGDAVGRMNLQKQSVLQHIRVGL